MTKLPVIKINIFQLNILLNKERKKGVNHLLTNGVYCSTCKDVCSKGINTKEIYLNQQNDIVIKSSCKVCHKDVTRIIEFGENEGFYEWANEFRLLIR